MEREKKSVGRPKKPEDQRKKVFVRFRATVEQRDELHRRAKAKNQTLTEYLLDGKLPKRSRTP